MTREFGLPRHPTISHFQVFACLWAGATILDLGKWIQWLATPAEFFLFISCFAVLLKPSSVTRFAILAVLQIAITLWKMPWVSNHSLLAMIVNMTILASIVSAYFKRDGSPLDREYIFAEFAPIVRAEALLLYGFVTLHKLNSSWFDPEVSCAVVFWHKFTQYFPWLQGSPWVDGTMPVLAIGVEAIILFFLAFRRLRTPGIIIAGLFHIVLGVIGFFRFASLMYALLFLFLPVDFFERTQGAWKNSSIRRRLEPLRRYFIWKWINRAALSLLALLTIVVFMLQPWREFSQMFVLVRDGAGGSRPTLSYIFQTIWFIGSVGLLVVFARIVIAPFAPAAPPGRSEIRTRVNKWLWVFPALLCINGFSPYLGLKTESSFSMFSNVRLSGRGSNHLLFRTPLKLNPQADQLVQIHATSDPVLQSTAEKNYFVPMIELASYVEHRVRRGDDFSIDFEYQERRTNVESVRENQQLFPTTPWILRKLTRFRPVDMRESCRCTH